MNGAGNNLLCFFFSFFIVRGGDNCFSQFRSNGCSLANIMQAGIEETCTIINQGKSDWLYFTETQILKQVYRFQNQDFIWRFYSSGISGMVARLIWLRINICFLSLWDSNPCWVLYLSLFNFAFFFLLVI